MDREAHDGTELVFLLYTSLPCLLSAFCHVCSRMCSRTHHTFYTSRLRALFHHNNIDGFLPNTITLILITIKILLPVQYWYRCQYCRSNCSTYIIVFNSYSQISLVHLTSKSTEIFKVDNTVNTNMVIIILLNMSCNDHMISSHDAPL